MEHLCLSTSLQELSALQSFLKQIKLIFKLKHSTKTFLTPKNNRQTSLNFTWSIHWTSCARRVQTNINWRSIRTFPRQTETCQFSMKLIPWKFFFPKSFAPDHSFRVWRTRWRLWHCNRKLCRNERRPSVWNCVEAERTSHRFKRWHHHKSKWATNQHVEHWISSA